MVAPGSDHGQTDVTGIVTLPTQAIEYVRLVEASGQLRIHGKRERIDPALEPVLTRLGFSTDEWLSATTAFALHYRRGELKLKRVA